MLMDWGSQGFTTPNSEVMELLLFKEQHTGLREAGSLNDCTLSQEEDLEKVKYINKPRALFPVLCSPWSMNENLQQWKHLRTL